MDIFENAATWTKQGDIGEARAIYELTRLGYSVSTPLADSAKYDVIFGDGQNLNRVQVKTCTSHPPYNDKRWIVNLKTSGGSNTKIINRKDGDYDYLFILAKDGDCWLIPEKELANSKAQVTVGAGAYDEYKVK